MEKTPNLQLRKPAINGEETENVWGYDLNSNCDILDQWAITLAPLQHQHPISDIADLQDDLDGKADTEHYHQSTAITDFPTAAYAELKRDLRAGPNIGIVPDDNAQTLTISAAGGGSGAGVVDGDKGDIIVSGTGVNWNFDPAVVTAFARTLLDDADLAAAQTTLGFAALQTDIAARVLKAGDTMTGPLVLAGNPTALLDAAPKQYVDSKAGGAAINDGPPANPVHGQMWWESDTGGLFLFYDDGTSAQWVQINAGVAGATLAGVVIGDGPPANPAPGQLWWESDTGLLFVFYNDGNTTQWVQVNSVATGVPEAPLVPGNEYVRVNGVWRLKEQSFDPSGAAQQDIAVPAGAKMAQITGVCFNVAATTNQVGLRISHDGTTFFAGASDYAVGGGAHATGSNAFYNIAGAPASFIPLSPAGDVVGYPFNFSAEIGLVRPNTALYFNAKSYGGAYSSSAANGYVHWWINGYMLSGTSLAIKALRINPAYGGNFGPSSTINVRWMY